MKWIVRGVCSLGLLGLAGCSSSSSTGPGGVGNPEGVLYVPNQADATMYVFETRTMVRVDSFPLPLAEPHFVVFAPDTAHYYVVDRQPGGQLAKYSAGNDSLVALVSVQGTVFPTAAAISANSDTLYLTDFTLAAGRTHRYDVSGSNLVWLDSTLQAGHQTHDIRISSDGRYVASAGFSSDDISLLDTQTGNVLPLTLDSARQTFNPVSNDYGPYGVLFDRLNRMVITACSKGDDQIRLIDIVNRTILDTIPVPVSNTGNAARNGPTYMALHPDNNILFVTNYLDNTVSVIRLSTREVIETIEFETPKPFGIVMTDDGTRLFVSCTNTRPDPGRVYLIDTETFTKLDSVDVGSEPFGLAWRPLKP
jgi:YVTN family beta-propeller protein